VAVGTAAAETAEAAVDTEAADWEELLIKRLLPLPLHYRLLKLLLLRRKAIRRAVDTQLALLANSPADFPVDSRLLILRGGK